MSQKRIDELLHMFNKVAPIARTLGMSLSFNSERQAIVELSYNPGLDHALGRIHGGVYAIMLDTAGWFTSAAAHDVDCWIATSEMSMHLLLPAERTSLRAVGRLIKRSKRQDVAEMHLYNGEGKLMAHATGTFEPVWPVAGADSSALINPPRRSTFFISRESNHGKNG